MVEIITLSINAAQKQFIKERGLSPSKLMQDLINKKAKEEDPEMYQSRIKEFESEEDKHMTKWQRALEYYGDDDRKRDIVILLAENASGVNIIDQVRKGRITQRELDTVLSRINSFK